MYNSAGLLVIHIKIKKMTMFESDQDQSSSRQLRQKNKDVHCRPRPSVCLNLADISATPAYRGLVPTSVGLVG